MDDPEVGGGDYERVDDRLYSLNAGGDWEDCDTWSWALSPALKMITVKKKVYLYSSDSTFGPQRAAHRRGSCSCLARRRPSWRG